MERDEKIVLNVIFSLNC